MFAISLALLFLIGSPQESLPQQSDSALSQRLAEAQQLREATRQAAIHINDLAGRIHSEADAQAFVEQRVVNIWNEYVRELDAPEETLVTAAELHNLRDASFTMNKRMWKKDQFPQSLWTMPDVYAVDAEGKVARGCRAVEALKILHDMSFSFQSVLGARNRVQKGILVSDMVRQSRQDAAPRPQPVQMHGELKATRNENPVRLAEYHYVQAHGERDYQRLLQRLSAELLPE
jgi:hypothetical protein